MFKSYILTVIFTFLITAGIHAQSVGIKGVVEDPSKAPIAGAVVVIRNKATGLERVATTDADGRFDVIGLGADEYEVTARANGFSAVKVTASPSVSDVMLDLSVETVRENVTVFSGSRQAELQESLNTSVEIVTRRDIENTGYQTVGEMLKEVP